MDDKTLTALKQSIEEWECNAVAETPEDFRAGVFDCALCGLFWRDNCNGCPVRAETGAWRCLFTPYAVAEGAYDEWVCEPARAARRDAARAAARVEVEFLRSLLPKAEETTQ